MAQDIQRHCGKLMERFGYGKEPEWLDKLSTDYEKEFA
jgi:hypothetical protein